MTAPTFDTPHPGVATLAPPKKKPVVERPRFPLVWKIFFLTAALIALVVAISVGLTITRAHAIARTTVDASITSAARLFRDFERQRLSRLALTTQLLGNDPHFVAYIQSAMSPAPEPAGPGAPAAAASPAVNYADIVDQLIQRKESLGSDLMMLVDQQGNLLGRSDRPAVSDTPNQNVAADIPLVRQIVEDASIPVATGVIADGSRLYHAAVAPLVIGANNVRLGYLVNAYAIDDAFANKISELTNAGVVFASTAGLLGRSKSAPQFTMQQMSGVENIFRSGRMMPPRTVTIDQSRYVMTGEPMTAGTRTAGAAVFLRSLDSELAPFRQIQNALLLGGGIALLLAFILSWFIAKRVTRPIEELAGIAQAVTAGDYSVHPGIDRQDEVGILGRSFAKMITSLRDKAELEELYEQMAARSQERGAVRLSEPAALDEGTVLVTDLRGLPATVGEGDAANVIASVARAMKMQEAEVERQEGVVREIVGHRLLSVFRGERGILHAIRAARAINEELAAGETTMQIGVGIATGEFVTGSVDLQQESGLAIVGNAPLLAMLFAWHAPTGYAYISYETAQAAGGDILSSSSREQVQLRWLAQPLPVAAVPLVSLNTHVMRSIGAPATSEMETLRVEGTMPGKTAPPSPAAAELSNGALFANRYRIDQILGRGGMGIVYKAVDTQLDETVAIKTLPGDVMQRSPEDLERFKREIRLARKITHRNVLRTYDYGEADGVVFISMEYVRGYTLAELLDEAEDRRMAPRPAMGLARQICRGLHAAHEQGIIHRDIKPQNVLIDHKGDVKLMDFGIARMAEAKEGMTQAGLIVGTPHYMSPEQVRGQQLDARSDVYSMGVMLYEILAGQKPFTSSSLTGVLTAHITETPKPLIEVRPDAGREINAIVMRCLAKAPKERYADAGALLADLDRVRIATVQAAAA